MTDFDHEDTLDETIRTGTIKPFSQDYKKVRATIVQNNGPNAPRTFQISKHKTVIGRDSSCNIIIETKELSRRHVVVTIDESEINIEDLDSANGLFLNGVKIHSATMKNGDEFQIGGVVLSFREGTV